MILDTTPASAPQHKLTTEAESVMKAPIDPEAEVFIATLAPASAELVTEVMAAPIGNDGRSGWHWMRLANGDLCLCIFPCGDTYTGLEGRLPPGIG